MRDRPARIAVAFLLLSALPQSGSAAETIYPRTRGQPADVRALVERIVDCNHWLGEEPYDSNRKKEIEQAISELRCDDPERDIAQVRKKYPGRRVRKAVDEAKQAAW